ncbi:ThiF family adenylyltransferase [Phytoactinopolyspora endophytica]|uniref:ThiF family adenylyltransferase n=1 Tax=Phytoactinopolyspora endophytica TaxID=1642495 RepID=UPI00101C7692|nr:ThiF family adenylyltransferase [Phytoactinopolyspora endophytica]
MDGNNDLCTLRDLATTAGGSPDTVDRLLELLIPAGAIVDRDAIPDDDGPLRQSLPDRVSLSLLDRSLDGGGTAFARRGQRRITIHGAGRVGASVARLLDAGGIGDVHVDDQELVTHADVSPGGHPADGVGIARDRSLHRFLDDGPAAQDSTPPETDFAVIDSAVCAEHPHHTGAYVRAGVAHLLVKVTEVTGIVGPLVVPGESACVRCLDLHRTDRDHAWPMMLDQAGRYPPEMPACDASLSAAVAGLAAGQVLAYLDGYDVSALNGTIELELPYGLPRRRSWQPHPDCGCTWQ